MSNNNDNTPSDEEIQEGEAFAQMIEQIKGASHVVYTPEVGAGYSEGTAWLYSVGMNDNYGIPDLQMRGVPSSFFRTAGTAINEMNAYRLLNPDKPFLVGQRVGWGCGDFVIHESEAWDGAYSWEKEDMLTLLPPELTIEHCHCCDMENAGVEP